MDRENASVARQLLFLASAILGRAPRRIATTTMHEATLQLFIRTARFRQVTPMTISISLSVKTTRLQTKRGSIPMMKEAIFFQRRPMLIPREALEPFRIPIATNILSNLQAICGATD